MTSPSRMTPAVGTPLVPCTNVPNTQWFLNSLLSRAVAPSVITDTRTMLTTTKAIGVAGRPARRRRAASQNCESPNSTQMPMARTQPQRCGRYEPAIDEMCLSKMLIVPCVPTMCICTPCHASNPARVTTNEGTPITANQKPWKAPIAAPVTTASRMAQYHFQPLSTSAQASSVMPSSITEPTERSISPRSSTSTMPTAIVPVTPIWRMRLERFLALRNVGSLCWK